MTTEEFMGALPKDGWSVSNVGGLIRRNVSDQTGNIICACPITSINNVWCGFYKEEAITLNIDTALRDDIIAASDNILNRPNLYDLRQKLLRALNLI